MTFSKYSSLIYILLVIYISTIQAISITKSDIINSCLAPKSDNYSLNNSKKIMITKNWELGRSSNDSDERINKRHFLKHLKLASLKIRREFRSFRENFDDTHFLSNEEKQYILSCESLILNYLKAIGKKIQNGKMKPWKDTGDVKISIFSGTYDYPTMAHLLLMLDNLADPNVSSDFIVLFLEPDSNNKAGKINEYSLRERLIKILIEPFGELFRYCDYGKSRKYVDVVGKLMTDDYPEASNWIHVLGSDVFNRFGEKFNKDIDYWKDKYYINKTNPLKFGYHIYNRGDEKEHIQPRVFEDFVEKYNIRTYIKNSPIEEHFQKLSNSNNKFPSVTAFKNGTLRVIYPSIVNVLYAGYQLRYSWDNKKNTDVISNSV